MANISLLSRLVNGVQRQVDLSVNTLVVQAIQINGTLLSSSGGTAGSTLVGDNNSYSNFTPAAATVKGALSGIDTALAGKASTTLNNLGTTSINSDLLPSADNTQSIGSAALRWVKLWALSVDANGSVLTLNGSAISANSLNITNLADGVNPQDAVNLRQTQALVNGLSWKTVVRSATTTTLPANTYNNGASGVGATLTGNANGALSAQDGVTLVANDRLLVKNEAASANNGIYVLTTVGTGSTPYVLTRATDSDTSGKLAFEAVQVGSEATTQAGYSFRETTAAPITIGTTAINYANWATGLAYNFRNGLTTSGANVDVTPGDNSLTATPGSLIVKEDPAGAIVTGASGIKAQVDGTSITINGSNQLQAIGTSAVQFTETAGQSFLANTTYAVRYGLSSNGETVGRVYAADITTTSFDLFWVIGFIQTTGAVSAGNTVTVIAEGTLTLESGDTNFSTADTGKAIYLQAGGLNATTTAPSTSGQAVAALGVVRTTTSFRINIKSPYVF